jgi:hypothetical protein
MIFNKGVICNLTNQFQARAMIDQPLKSYEGGEHDEESSILRRMV